MIFVLVEMIASIIIPMENLIAYISRHSMKLFQNGSVKTIKYMYVTILQVILRMRAAFASATMQFRITSLIREAI